jgi:uncharacterized membrane protein YbaN (DUF454 family)
MNQVVYAWIGLIAVAAGFVGCFLEWTAIAHQPTFEALETSSDGQGISLRLQTWTLGLLLLTAGYLAWEFRSNPQRKYAQLMVLFGLAMLMILTSARPWQWADVGLKPAVGFYTCGSAALTYLVVSTLAYFSTRHTVQS